MKNAEFEISAHTLKWIALISMTIDHIGVALFEVFGRTDLPLRAMGRIAFPMFIFLLAEGFFHTHSRTYYLLRLFLFCFISEIPFDLTFFPTDPTLAGSRLFYPQYQNIFLTLCIGFFVILAVENILCTMESTDRLGKGVQYALLFLCLVILAAGMAAAQYLHSDYRAAGVLAIFVAYIAKRHGISDPMVYLLGSAVLLLVGWLELFAFAGVLPIFLYHGKKGRTIHKWFFYLYFPGHLLALWAIRVFLIAR